MPQLRKYRYLLALAREQHFGRAAAACNITQPSLSNAIRQMEEELGVTIVERGRVFRGFTPEGQVVLDHARRIVRIQKDLETSLQVTSHGLTGQVKIGVIPSALPMVAGMVKTLRADNPNLDLSVLAGSADSILRELNSFDLDAGITYLDQGAILEPGRNHLVQKPVYTERYYFLASRALVADVVRKITWKEAAAYPLCLLTPDMLNRQIADDAFARQGITVAPRVETNSLINLMTLVADETLASIVPASLLDLTGFDDRLVALPLHAPVIEHSIGLVALDMEPASPVVTELFAKIDSI